MLSKGRERVKVEPEMSALVSRVRDNFSQNTESQIRSHNYAPLPQASLLFARNLEGCVCWCNTTSLLTCGTVLCKHGEVQLQTTLVSRFHKNNNSSPVK